MNTLTVEPPAFDFRPTACPVCGADRPYVLGWRGGTAHQAGAGVRTRVVRCGACSHLYPNPMPHPVGGPGRLYGGVEVETYFRGHDVERKKRVGLGRMRLFEEVLGRRGRYLDVGCGLGEYLWAARHSGWECVGVDPSETFLDWGRRHLGVDGRLGTLEDADLDADSFDVVTLESVVEHVYDPFGTLAAVRRVLRPGGLVWFDVPNEDSLYCRAGNLYLRARGRDWVINMAPTFPPYHVQGFNPRSVRRLLERVGLAAERVRVCGGVCPQTGRPSLRKRLEDRAARLVNAVGRWAGMGTCIEVWALKLPEARRGGLP